MKRVDVLWLVEHVAREMDVACAVKALAERRHGLRIAIRNMYADAVESMRTLEPCVVVHPFFYFCKGALATEDYVARWPDAIHFNLAWEEIHYKVHQKIKAPSDEFTKKKVLHHAWGDFYREYLMSHGVPASHIFVNGHPAYQLYRHPYCRYFRSRAELAAKYGLNPDTRWIFVPENYRWAFIGNKVDLFVKLGADRDEIVRLRDFSLESLAHLLRWCNEVARERGLEVVFRTRPSTNSETMHTFFAKRVGEAAPRLRFIKEGSVREWVLTSDVVISSYSTTLIEASLARKPVYMAEPLPLPDSLLYEWYQYAVRVKTAEEFRQACLDERRDAGSDLGRWAEGEMLARGDPLVGLADYVAGLARQSQRLSGVLQRAWRRVIGPSPALSPDMNTKRYFNAQSHENDLFNQTDVENAVTRWKGVLTTP